MTAIRSFTQRHPLSSFFALTFLLSWGGVLVVIGGPGNLLVPLEATESLLPAVLLVMFIGPCVAGLLMTALVHGRPGLRDLGARARRWRVDRRVYAVALLTTPVVATVLLLVLSVFSPDFLPDILTSNDKLTLLLTGIIAGVVVGIFEETGWTGFAVPELRRQHGVLQTGLIVGFVWAAWHFLVYIWGSADGSGGIDFARILTEYVFLLAVLPAYRVLMVWVYDRSESLLVAMLMHAIHTGATTAILVPQVTGVPRIGYYLLFGAVLWAIALTVTRAEQVRPESATALPGD